MFDGLRSVGSDCTTKMLIGVATIRAGVDEQKKKVRTAGPLRNMSRKKILGLPERGTIVMSIPLDISDCLAIPD